MKIWFDSVPETKFDSDRLSHECNECNECHECNECAECVHSDLNNYPIYHSSILTNFLLTKDTRQRIQTHPIQQIVPLYIQECIHERWFVYSCTESLFAVLDQEALTLLEQFRTPKTLLDAVQGISGRSSLTTIERAVTLFSHLGFFQDVEFPLLTDAKDLSQTLSAWLHVTNACNLRCHYCYIHKTSEHMANETAKRAVDAIFRSAMKHSYKHIQLKYAGGEASLHFTNVLSIHDYATQLAQQHSIKLHAYIMSNGVALSQRVIDQLKERHINVMISLDGIGSYHDVQRPLLKGQGSFKYVDRTIDRLLANHLVPHISVTVSQRNVDGLLHLMEYILEREMPFTFNYYRENVYSTHFCDLQFAEEQMITAMRSVFGFIEQRLPKRSLLGSLIDKANMRTAHRHTCGVGRNYLVIDQHGGVTKCQADIKQTVTSIDADDPLQDLRDDYNGVLGLSVDDKEGCRTCQWRYWCTGGCPLLTYRVTGRSDIKSPNCNIYQALFPDVLRLEALRLLKYTSPTIL